MTEERRQFLARVRAAAPAAEARGVPAAVMLAQAIVESGWGRSGLTRMGNALFGIKATGWPGAVYSGTTREIVARRSVKFVGKHKLYPSRAAALADGCNPVSLFRAYGSFEESILDHARLFHRVRRRDGSLRYGPCLEQYARDRDPFAFARCIHRAGYATSLTYTETLHGVMRAHAADLLPGGAPPMPPELPKLPVVFVDGQQIPSTAVRIIDGRLYLHARLAFESLGYRVDYNAQTKVVTIHKGDR